MSLKSSSSRVEKGTFFNGVFRKDKGKGFGREACQSVIGFERGFKILTDDESKMLSHKL